MWSDKELYEAISQLNVSVAEIQRDIAWSKEKLDSICEAIDDHNTEIGELKDFKSKILGMCMALSFFANVGLTLIFKMLNFE